MKYTIEEILNHNENTAKKKLANFFRVKIIQLEQIWCSTTEKYQSKYPRLAQKRRLPLLVSGSFLLILAPTLFLIIRNANKVDAAWWDDTWHYRKSVSVSSASADQTDFQVLLSGYNTSSDISAGKMRSDCGDIRFTSSAGVPLPYWIEDGTCNTASTNIWIKLNSIPSSGGTTIYMYYGNSSASKGSSGNSTFPFFDDFENTTLNGQWESTGAYSISGGAITITTGALYTVDTILSSAQGYTYEHKSKWSATSGSYGGLHIANAQSTQGSNSGSNALVYFMTQNASLNVTSWGADSTAASYNIVSNGTEYTATADTYYINSFSMDPSSIRFYNNRSALGTYGGTWIYNNAPYMFLGYFQGSASSTADLRDQTTDWVLVRKYDPTTPTVSAGSEEKGTSPIAYYSFDEGYGTTVHNQMEKNGENGLVGWWKMDETSGIVVNDAMGNANGTNNNSTITDGKTGKSLDFNSTTSYVSITDNTALATDYTTVSAWINPDTFVTGSPIYNRRTAGNVGGITFELYQTSGLIRCYVYIDGNWRNAQTTTALSTGQWSNVACSYDGSSIKVYVNGNLDGSTLYSGSMNKPTSPAVEIGRNIAGSNGYWDGKIDNVKVYNRALTNGEIAAEYNSLHGHTINSPTWTEGAQPNSKQKPLGKSLNFNGSDQYVNADNAASQVPTGSNDVTISAWVKWDTIPVSNNSVIVAYGGNNTDTGFLLHVENTTGNKLMFTVFGNSYATSGITPSTDQWYHVVGTYNHNQIKIYVNGQLKGETNASGNILSASTFRIGGEPNRSYFIDGQVDEVKLYNSALTSDQVKNLYNRSAGSVMGAAAFGNAGNPPIGFWKLDEGSGYTAFDSSGNNNHAAFTNMDPASDWVQGKIGKGIDLDGTNDTLNIPTLNNFPTTMTDITIGFWAYPREGVDDSIIQAATDDANNRINIHLHWGGNTIYWDFGNISSGGRLSTTFNSDWLNQWAYYTFTAKSGEGMKIYRNGILIASNATTSTFTSTGKSLIVGYHSAGYYWNGQIDQLKIYDYARSTDQIHQDMGGSPIAYYDFNEGRGTTIHNTMESNGEYNLGGWWKMDETSGSSVADEMGRTTGTATGTTIIDGKIGKARSFTSSDNISLGNQSIVDNNANVTVMGWIYTTNSDAAHHRIFSEETVLYVGQYGNQLAWYTGNGTSWEYNNNSLGTINTSTWYHVAYVKSGSTCTTYINGAQSGSFTCSSTLGTSSNTNYISTSNGSSQPWGGYIDNLKLFNRALSATEISTDYNSLHAAAIGGATWADGAQPNSNQKPLGKALTFNGSNQYVSAGTSSNFNFGSSDSFTISTWIKPSTSAIGTDKRIISKFDQVGDEGYILGTVGSTYLSFFIRDQSGNTTRSDYPASNFTANTWYHLVAVRDVATDKTFLYVNGSLVDSDTDNSTTSLASSVPLNFGKEGNSGSNYYYDGVIDEVKLYNYPLTASEIMIEYNRGQAVVLGSGTSESQPSSSSLKGWWKLDESSGYTAFDTSSNNYIATLTNGPTWVQGKIGKALNFDGTDDIVTATGFPFYSTYTLSAWIKPDSWSVDGYRSFISRGAVFDNNTNYAFAVRYRSASDNYRLTLYMKNTSTEFGMECIIDNPTYSWHHAVATFDNSTQLLTFYYDGRYLCSNTMGQSPADGSQSLKIGSPDTTDSSDDPFDGLIDDVKVFNTVLNTSQIAYEYNQGKPFAHWRFDEKDGPYAKQEYKNESTTNLITNPSVETNTTNWNPGAGNTIVQTNESAFTGSYSAKVTRPGVGGTQYNTWNGVTYTAGTNYVLSMFVRKTDGSAVTTSDITGMFIENTVVGIYSIDSVGGGWYRVLSGTRTAAGGSSNVGFYMAAGLTVYVDGVLLETASSHSAYCDGSLTGTGNVWSGTAHASTSNCLNKLDAIMINMDSSSDHVAGRFNNGLDFDGTDDIIYLAGTPGMAPTQLTISSWIKPTSTLTAGSYFPIFKKDANDINNVGAGYNFIYYSGSLYLMSNTDGDTSWDCNPSYAVELNSDQYYHVAITKGSSGATLYLNGKQVAQDTSSDCQADLNYLTYNNLVYIGYTYGSGIGSKFANGVIDEVKFYTYPLTEKQIMVDYNNGAAVRR